MLSAHSPQHCISAKRDPSFGTNEVTSGRICESHYLGTVPILSKTLVGAGTGYRTIMPSRLSDRVQNPLAVSPRISRFSSIPHLISWGYRTLKRGVKISTKNLTIYKSSCLPICSLSNILKHCRTSHTIITTRHNGEHERQRQQQRHSSLREVAERSTSDSAQRWHGYTFRLLSGYSGRESNEQSLESKTRHLPFAFSISFVPLQRPR